MRHVAVLLAAGLLVSAGSAARAQATLDLDARVTVGLTRHVTTTSTSGLTTRDAKVRIGTKDLLSLVNDSNATGKARDIVLRRTAVDVSTDPTALTFLDADLVFLDSAGAEVDPAPLTVTQTVNALTGVAGTSAVSSKSAAIGGAFGDLTSSKKLVTEGNTWVFDADGVGAAGDVLTLNMIGEVAISIARKTGGDNVEALWFGARTAKITGGTSFDADGGSAPAAVNGHLTGTIRASAERVP
jgi:hypothetical protein